MSPPPREQRRLAWAVIGLLFLGSVLNYVDRAVLGVVKPQVMEDLKLTNVNYGWAVNAFLMTYMVVYILGGRLADQVGARRMFMITIALWSFANMLHAFTVGFASLCFFRALLGIGEGGYYPTAMRGSAEWFAPSDRAKAVGIFLCGVSVGALIAPPAVAWFAGHFGWRASFLATGAIGFLLIPPWMRLHARVRRAYGTPDPVIQHASKTVVAIDPNEDLSASEALVRHKYWLVLMARAIPDSAWWFFLFWMPGYFQDVRHFDLKMVGQWLWIPYLAADFGAILGALISSRMIRLGISVDRSRKSVLIPSAILGSLGALAHFVDSPLASIGLISVALFGHMSWASNIQTAITEITPARHVALLYGITGAAGTAVGAFTQPIIGYAVDSIGYDSVFLCVGGVYYVAIVLLLIAGPIERMRRL
ncbi:MAG: MFS transporter [Planctomycetes bacterium]|nr:MFS transporter [Planctomycetota bacterium]